MALEIVLQPVDVLVPEGSTTVKFSVSGADPGSTIIYQWKRKNIPSSSSFVDIAAPAGTLRELLLSPIAEYDNDTFVALVSSSSVTSSLTSNVVTFGIRLSGQNFSNFETLTEAGSARRRRLVALGYI